MYEKYLSLKKKKSLKEGREISDYRVSKETGIPRTTIYSWKNSNNTPRANNLKTLADYFGVSIEYFFN